MLITDGGNRNIEKMKNWGLSQEKQEAHRQSQDDVLSAAVQWRGGGWNAILQRAGTGRLQEVEGDWGRFREWGRSPCCKSAKV